MNFGVGNNDPRWLGYLKVMACFTFPGYFILSMMLPKKYILGQKFSDDLVDKWNFVVGSYVILSLVSLYFIPFI